MFSGVHLIRLLVEEGHSKQFVPFPFFNHPREYILYSVKIIRMN
jgi:hypothetical protein